MTAFLVLLAVLAGIAAFVSWRSGLTLRAVASLGGIAVALSVAAWIARPGVVAGDADGPDAWVVDSAMAFGRAGMTPTMQGTGGAGSTAGSLPELADRLAAKLRESPEDAEGWALLATTYRQLGRDTDAEEAERRAIEAGADPAALAKAHQSAMGSAGSMGRPAMAGGAQSPGAKYVIEGQRLKVQRKFHEAELEFRKAVEADPGDADSWADLADCAAVAADHDLTVGREAIDRALAINPNHRKALWLRASLELQEGRHAAAAATWRTLSGLVPVDSPDARVIAANIVEAEALAAKAGG